jgi:hypothetical protein
MTSTKFLELHRAIGQLRRCVEDLADQAGDSPAVRRLANDVERLDVDAEDIRLQLAPAMPGRPAKAARPVVHITETPYDPALWREADDEGISGHRRSRI